MALSQTDVAEYLRSKGLEIWPAAGGREITTRCLFCTDEHRKGKLYVNASEGMWSCKICGESGSFRALMEHLGDTWDDEHPMAKPSRRIAINTEYTTLAAQHLTANAEALGYFRDRGLSPATISRFRFGLHPKGRSLVDDLPGKGNDQNPSGYSRKEIRETGLLDESGREFLEGRLIIPYMSGNRTVQLRGRQWSVEWGGKYVTTPGEKVRLFNSDDLRHAEIALLCEGELDGALAWQHLSAAPDVKARKIGVVAIPGAESIPEGEKGFPELFEHIKRVYVCMDTDDAGRRAALRIKDILGSKARILDLSRAEDLTDYMNAEDRDWQDLLRLMAEADMRSKRIYTVEESDAQLYALDHGKPGLKLGWPSIDALIAPGLYPGSITVPLARTGVGKTAIALNIAYKNRHRPTLFITLELTAAEVWNRMRRISRFHEPQLSEAERLHEFPNLRWMDENRITGHDFTQLMDEFTEEVGSPPELVVVDYLGYYARGVAGRDNYSKSTEAVMELKALAKEHEVALISPGQVNRTAKEGEPIDVDAARDSGAVEETSDFLFGFLLPWEAESVVGASGPGMVQSELMCRILKSRRGNKGRQAALHFSHVSLVVVDPTDRAAVNKVQMENEAHNRGEKYESIWKKQQEHARASLQGALAPWEE